MLLYPATILALSNATAFQTIISISRYNCRVGE